MHNLNLWLLFIGVVLLALLLSGCGGTAPPSTEPPPPPTDTLSPPTEPPPPPATDAPLPPATAPTGAQLPTPTATVKPPTPTAVPPTEALSLSTAAFAPGGDIPTEYTCFGDNRSPDLAWAGVPSEAQSLVLLFYDPDAGAEAGASTSLGFAHWIVYNIPPESSGYAADMPAGETLADGAHQGANDFAGFVKPGDTFPGGAPIKVTGYDGPCPGGKHRYIFHLYALDRRLGLPPAAALSQVLAAMEGHILAQDQVSGFFAPPR